jgi:DNA-directed RNA polymerase specialized sigma24 family protein
MNRLTPKDLSFQLLADHWQGNDLLLGAASQKKGRRAANDNGVPAVPGGIPDTTALVARPEVVRYIRATLRRRGVALQDRDDAVADVQTDAIAVARTGRMPADVAQWKALAARIAARWTVDRVRESKARSKYDAGLCEDADPYCRPTLFWEERDSVDTRRYLAVLDELFDSGQMPQDGAEILWGEAEQVAHEDIAAEIGVTESTVNNRLSRMRARFRARLAALGMLTLLLLVVLLPMPMGSVSTPEPKTQLPPPASVRPGQCVPATDAGTPDARRGSADAFGYSKKSSAPVREKCAVSD